VGIVPQLRIKLMEDVQAALERLDEVNNSLANELVRMQIKYGMDDRDGDAQ